MPLSGKYGAVNGVGSVANWNINDEHAPSVAVDSATGAGTQRTKGIESWDGSYMQNLYEPTVLPGVIGAFLGFTAPIDGVPTGDGVTYAGQHLISQSVINWDWAGGNHITVENTFLGHLVLTPGTGNVQDATFSSPPTVCGTKIEYSANGTDWTELTDISTAGLTLQVATDDYVNSSTGCWTGRNAGPKDWTAAIVLDNDDRTTNPAKGAVLQFRFYVTGALFYLCKWGMVRNYTGITVDRATGAIIQQTLNVDMVASDGTALGVVSTPSGADWWGTSA